MVREVTIYNYNLTPDRKKHYDSIIEELKVSGFKKTFAHIDHGNNTIKFWSYSMNGEVLTKH